MNLGLSQDLLRAPVQSGPMGWMHTPKAKVKVDVRHIEKE